ncbi:hypothetical protein DPMN_074314 [Dreissena polymorpha]|uniref:C2H2-type domain-containing protein n=1 Tax=Dreissena polymorpha TaxID=45954 RepID=A0A9D3YJH8_DREPO|nr:hypothetical protein DPMN_074314 [Dreissena polymorpha]
MDSRVKGNRNHKQTEEKQMSYVCRFSGDPLKTTWGLKRHEERHRGLSKYSCCEKQLSTKDHIHAYMWQMWEVLQTQEQSVKHKVTFF